MKRLLGLLIVVSSISCIDKDSFSYHLNNGLSDYQMKRPVNEKLNEDIFVQDIAFFKQDSTFIMVLKLDENTKADVVEKYSLAIHAFVDKAFLVKRDDYLLLDYKPELIKYDANSYLVKEFKTNAKRLDSLDLFLYDRDKYRQILGRKITIRNIGL